MEIAAKKYPRDIANLNKARGRTRSRDYHFRLSSMAEELHYKIEAQYTQGVRRRMHPGYGVSRIVGEDGLCESIGGKNSQLNRILWSISPEPHAVVNRFADHSMVQALGIVI